MIIYIYDLYCNCPSFIHDSSLLSHSFPILFPRIPSFPLTLGGSPGRRGGPRPPPQWSQTGSPSPAPATPTHFWVPKCWENGELGRLRLVKFKFKVRVLICFLVF